MLAQRNSRESGMLQLLTGHHVKLPLNVLLSTFRNDSSLSGLIKATTKWFKYLGTEWDIQSSKERHKLTHHCRCRPRSMFHKPFVPKHHSCYMPGIVRVRQDINTSRARDIAKAAEHVCNTHEASNPGTGQSGYGSLCLLMPSWWGQENEIINVILGYTARSRKAWDRKPCSKTSKQTDIKITFF